MVIGEHCIDKFIYCKCDRLMPEAPAPIFIPQYNTENQGMAANVWRNLELLGNECHFLTHKTPILKTRYIEQQSNQCVVRIDENDFVTEAESFNEQMLFDYLQRRNLKAADFDAVVISSYNKGFLTPTGANFIINLFGLHEKPTFMDCKWVLGGWSKNAFCVKINEKEYNENKKSISFPDNFCKNLVVTLGSRGALLVNKNKEFAAKKVEVSNVSGAGDMFITGLLSKFLETNNLEEGVKYGNACSGFKVSRRGIEDLNIQEVNELYSKV